MYEHSGSLVFSLVLSIGQRLCIKFFVSRAKFPTTLRSDLDVTYSGYFWSSLGMNIEANSIFHWLCL